MKGKTCVITGATSGIGRAVAVQLGGLGADLILTGRNERRGNKLLGRVQRDHAGGNARFMKADLSGQPAGGARIGGRHPKPLRARRRPDQQCGREI